jgi:hypothetical protein
VCQSADSGLYDFWELNFSGGHDGAPSYV